MKKSTHCENCKTLIQENKELKEKLAPKPFILEVENEKQANFIETARALNILKEGEKTRAFASRKEYDKLVKEELKNPNNAPAIIALYGKKGWSLEKLESEWKDAKKRKEDAWKVARAESANFKKIDMCRRASKALSTAQFDAVMDKLVNRK